MPNVEGLILKGAVPVKDVEISAIRVGDGFDERKLKSDANGKFNFSLPSGKWKISAYIDESNCVCTLIDVLEINIDLGNISTGSCKKTKRHDFSWGLGTFIFLIFLLALLILGYLNAHKSQDFSDKAITIVDLIEKANKRLVKDPLPTTKRVVALKNDKEFTEAIRAIRENWNVLAAANKDQLATKKLKIEQLLSDLDKEIKADDPEKNSKIGGIEIYLSTLKSYINPYTQGYFWETEPLRSLEIVYWGLAGVLVTLIITVGSYMRFERFYRVGIFQHVAQIVSLPIMALVFVYLISQVQFVISVPAAGDVKLELTDPKILAAISFLIGSRFWSVWGFLQDTGDKITGQTGS